MHAPATRRPAPRVRPRAAVVAALGAGLCAAGIVALTLAPADASLATPADWRCVACAADGGADFLANVLLFVPLGIALAAAGIPAGRAWAAAAALSLVIELAQGAGIPGRTAAAGDLLANALGAALGLWLGTHWRPLLRPSPRRALALAALTGALWTAVLATGTWLLGRDPAPGPRPPRIGTLPFTPGFGYYRGRVLRADVDAWTSPPRRGSGPAIVGAATGRAVRGSATVAGGDGRPSLVPALFVHDALGRPQLLVGQRGPDAVARVRLRAARWRLRQPELVLPGALAAHPAPATTLSAAFAGDTLALAVTTPAGRRAARLRLTAARGWTLLPFPRHWNAASRPLAAAWLGAGFLPALYWLARAVRARRRR